MKTFALSLACLSLVACSELPGLGQKSSAWYDFGNGVINLSKVGLIASTANIQFHIEPRGERGEYGSDERALYEAHEQFCAQHRTMGGLDGNIQAVSSKAPSQFSEFVKTIDFDVLKVCTVSLTGRAAIKFDDFTLTLSNLAVTLPSYDSQQVQADQLPVKLNKDLDTARSTATEWAENYRAVLSQIGVKP